MVCGSRGCTATVAIDQAISRFGSFHGLYHVAGGSGRKWGDGPLHEVTDDAWEQTIRQNLTSLFFSNRAALQAFLGLKQGGSILNVSSVLAFSPSPRFFETHAYATAKAAIIGLTRAAAARYAREDIRINALAPGLIDTPMSQRACREERILELVKRRQALGGGRVGLPSDLDGAVVFLMSDQSRFVTGQVLAIDGGWSVTDGYD